MIKMVESMNRVSSTKNTSINRLCACQKSYFPFCIKRIGFFPVVENINRKFLISAKKMITLKRLADNSSKICSMRNAAACI